MSAVQVVASPDLERMCGERVARVRAQMHEQGVDALVLAHGPHVVYTTGHVPAALDVTHAVFRRPVAVVTSAGPVHLFLPSDTTGAAGTGVDRDVPGVVVHGGLWPELDEAMPAFAAALGDTVGDLAGRRIAVDELTGAMRRVDLFAGADLVDAARVIGPARLIKTVDELACIEVAQRRNEQAMVAAHEACVPGVRRSAVAGAFLGRLAELGGRANMIDPIFEVVPRTRAAGWRTSTGHVAFPTGVGDPQLVPGDMVWVDAGIGYEGYVSDFGRTWIAGRVPTAEEQACFERWLAVIDAAYATIAPGATLGDVGRAAMAADPGEIPWLPHFYLAHGIGVESAEMPMIGTDLGQAFDDSFVLAAGMILVLEPVCWQDGHGGYRAEEVLAVTDDGWRLLGAGHTYAPYECDPRPVHS